MEISLKAEKLFSLGSLAITNGLLLALIVSLVLIVFSIIFRSKIKLIPGKIQGVVEMGIEALLGLMKSVLGTEEASEKYLPLIAFSEKSDSFAPPTFTSKICHQTDRQL